MDRVKKLKVKKSDGSFTDYIPIGADAAYVDLEDGSNVQDEMNKMYNKPYYFNSAADMKAAEYLKEGDCAITLGYYEANDGGAAEYKIRSKKSEDSEDNGSIHFIANNLVAELIIKDNIIPILTFGAKLDNNSFDNSPILNNILNKYNGQNYTIVFPGGTLYFKTPLVIEDLNHINFVGSNCSSEKHNIYFIGNGTFLTTQILHSVQFKRLNFNGNKNNYCFHFGSVIQYNSYFINLRFDNFKGSLYLERTAYVYLQYCQFLGYDIAEYLVKIGHDTEERYCELVYFDNCILGCDEECIGDMLVLNSCSTLRISNTDFAMTSGH